MNLSPLETAAPLREDAWLAAPALAEELAPHVYRAPLLRPSACAELLREIDARAALLRARGVALTPPNSMHEHGYVLEALGFGALLEDVRKRVAPLAERLLPQFARGELDAHHSYLVDYSSRTDEELGFHVDDSEVTVNVCLGDDFHGAELVMLGLRCGLHLQSGVSADEELEIVHETGCAIVHAGTHRHRVDPIRSGRRRNLIVWLRNSRWRAQREPLECQSWCGARR
jgi:hypothetical protein